MTDVFTPKKRSEIMSRIRAKNTGLELEVFRYLSRRKLYFQRHYSKAPGKPDIALPSKKLAVMIDSDFWHGWKFESTKTRLSRADNKKYWVKKIEGNIKRDIRNRRALRRQGWKVMRVWEHQLKKNPEDTLERIYYFLTEKEK